MDQNLFLCAVGKKSKRPPVLPKLLEGLYNRINHGRPQDKRVRHQDLVLMITEFTSRKRQYEKEKKEVDAITKKQLKEQLKEKKTNQQQSREKSFKEKETEEQRTAKISEEIEPGNTSQKEFLNKFS